MREKSTAYPQTFAKSQVTEIHFARSACVLSTDSNFMKWTFIRLIRIGMQIRWEYDPKQNFTVNRTLRLMRWNLPRFSV